jgi:hypothetical protein
MRKSVKSVEFLSALWIEVLFKTLRLSLKRNAEPVSNVKLKMAMLAWEAFLFL